MNQPTTKRGQPPRNFRATEASAAVRRWAHSLSDAELSAILTAAYERAHNDKPDDEIINLLTTYAVLVIDRSSGAEDWDAITERVNSIFWEIVNRFGK